MNALIKVFIDILLQKLQFYDQSVNDALRKKRGLKCPLNSMYKYSYYASWIASNTAAPLLTSYGKVVALSSNVML